MSRGKYIVIEGPQGSGKSTQISLIAEKLKLAGLPIRTFREPDSQSDLTARTIRHITQDPNYPLNSKTEVLLYNAARSQSLEIIRKSVAQGIICLVDRNYLSTFASQYYGRGDIDDYEALDNLIKFTVDDMEPDLTIILDAPVNDLIKRVENRYQGERFDNLSEDFLERQRAGYLWEAKQRGFPVVFAVEDQDEVFKNVWKLVTEELGRRYDQKVLTPAASIAEVIKEKNLQKIEDSNNSDQSLATKNEDGTYTITKEGKNYLEDVVTNTDQNVYAFTDSLSPATIAAAMARLSRRGDDMRVTILDEFAGKEGKDKDLLKRVITAYGDDSVQQLVGLHIVIENASNLATKKLEWGRLAAYLEQSTRYIYYDQKDGDGKYRYFIPEYLDKKLKSKYISTMDTIFDTYSVMVRKLTDHIRQNSSVPLKEQDWAWKSATKAQACDVARAVLPVATKSTVGIFASGQALESLISHLLSDELPESYSLGRDILKEARKVIPTFLERVDISERGVALQGYRAFTYQAVKNQTSKLISKPNSNDLDSVKLVDYWPKNELDIIADIIYEHSNLSINEIREETNNWKYKKKEKMFKTYIGERYNRRHKPGRALEKIHYSWDLVCDYGSFRDLQRHRMVDDMNWQQLTPRFGYETPDIIEEADLLEDYDKCFDLSFELYSEMQRQNYNLEKQYATLLGHKMRWKVTYNAREAFHFHELRTSPQGHPGYRKLVNQMHEKLAEVHPLIAESMIFVNKDEDTELTRLAAEKYTQDKLKKFN